ncbi:MAG: endonuclease domain-containing protein [Hyphomicrobiaceae bacterium]|nr:endonuclease domain-containing protein [Hyphomicrobiaceae bacterium]
MRANAKALRQAMTPAETLLWRYLKAHRNGGLGFRRQVPIGPYIVDFVCHEARLVVELDGESYDFEDIAAADLVRERWLLENGYRMLRFSNRDVLSNLEGALLHIRMEAGKPPINNEQLQ